MACVAITLSGVNAGHACGKPVRIRTVREVCGMHHNSLMGRDAAYRNAYNAAIAQQRQERLAEEQAQQLRAQQKYDEQIAKLANPSFNTIRFVTGEIIQLWAFNMIPTDDLLKAYIILRHLPTNTANYFQLVTACGLFVATVWRHGYNNVPEANRNILVMSIHALIEGVAVDIDLIVRDEHENHYRNRKRREAELARAEEQRVAAVLAEAARRAAFQQRLNNEPVVFQRDPEGGINLQAFANDAQSVHRSSVQTATERAIHVLLSRPLPAGQETLEQITNAWTTERLVKFGTETIRDRALMELTNDYYNTEAFSISYGDVLDRVWAFINPHVHRKTLSVRLAQEVTEGRSMCSNGKMARLVNVLQGFDETLDLGPTPEALRLMFQNKIAKVMERPMDERRAAAMALFSEFNIPEDERGAWLEPLLDA